MATSHITPDPQEFPYSFAALLDRQYERADFLRGLKQLIAAAQERIRQEHYQGARGRSVVRHLTALADDVSRTIAQHVITNHAADATPLALVALGGYGRGELNPFSDIDLMFLCRETPPDKVVREILYLLWDVGYSLGHSVRTRRDAVKMAEADLTAQTAMLEARLIDGDQQLFEWLQAEVAQRRFTPRRRRTFVRQKIAECRQRHAGFANTVNLMEPNIKESPGGLRDYHTALWVSMAFYQVHTLADLVSTGLLTPGDQHAIDMALDFLFRVRNALHYQQGRKNDLLSVDVQERLATALGFTPSANKLAVEHFLHTYYLHANVLWDFCQTVIEAVSHTSQGHWWRFLRRARPVEEGFVVRDGYVDYEASALAEAFTERPLRLMQAFARAQEHRVALAPALSRAIKAHATLLTTESMRRAPETAATFFRILAQAQAAPTLRAMHRHGLLAAYIPEFGALTCLAQHDLYHRYTVDEHTLLSIEMLESLAETREPSLQSLAQLYRQTTDKALLKFALLLHDLGKDAGPGRASHVHRSGDLSAVVCDRLGLSADQRHLVQVLAVHHLAMNRLAQRRDITDEKVIAELASMVENVPNLAQLYLLTFADTSAVGPGVWTIWKGTLLAEIYHRTREYLVRQHPVATPSVEELRERLRPGILEVLPAESSAAAVDRFLEMMPARYLIATPPHQIATHVSLTQSVLRSPVILHTEHNFSVGFTNVTICVAERRGVFSMIAGALSQNKLNILGAQIYTSRAGLAIDTLQAETITQTPVTDRRVWQQVEADLCAALGGDGHFDVVGTPRRPSTNDRKMQAFAQPPQVIMDNSSSDSHTILEVQAQDRLGLLYRLTRLLYELGLDIALAKISTEANRAIDVFYVTDAAGHKIVTPAVVDEIQQRLLEALH